MMDDLIGMGGGSVFGALALGVALFLRNKFVEKKNAVELEKPLADWIRPFLEAMTEDRREMKDLFRELAHEIRTSNTRIEAVHSRLEGAAGYFQQSHGNLGNALMRIENKTDALLQRKP